MTDDRKDVYIKYSLYLSESKSNYDIRGKRLCAALYYLNSPYDLNKRGYRKFLKERAEYLAFYPWTTDGVLHLFAFMGVGYRQLPKTGGSKKKAEASMERREVRQSEVINGFLLYLQNGREYSPNTLRIYSTGLSDYFSYFDEFTQDNCRRYIAQLGNEGKSPKTVRLRITALERLGEYLRKPVRIKRPKIQKTLNTENVPTEKEYNTLLDYLDGHNPKYAFIVRLLGTTGARVSELTQFTYEHIQQGNVVLSGKGDKYRRFFFQKRIQQEAKGKTGLVCLNRYGQPISRGGIRSMLQTFAEKTGIDKRKLHPHAFRHFFAKMYLKKTKDVVELADLLGHGSVDMTRLYLQKSYEEKRRDFNKSVDW